MPVVTNGRLLYVAHPTVYQEPGVHTKYVEEELDLDNVPLNGGILIKTLALSSDPYIRVRMRDPSIPNIFPPLTLNYPVDNFGVGTVVRSEDPVYKPGDYVYGYIGFEEYSVYPGPPEVQHYIKSLTKLDKHPDIPASTYVGILGMPGQTAYSGWNAFAREKAKDSKTLFISGAAGPVGMFLIPYVRETSPHLKIIASAGSEEKVALLKEVGVDVAFNYKTTDTKAVLAEHGPLDIYWDHVAGAVLDAALENMNFFGLIVRVGTSSGYNEEAKAGVVGMRHIVEKGLTMNGFIIGFGDRIKKAKEGFVEVGTKLLLEGKIKNIEQRYVGLKTAGQALADVHLGMNYGKAVIIVSED